MWSFFLEFPQILLSQRLNKMTTSAVLWIYIKVLLRIQVTLFTIKHKLELALIPRLSSLVHPVLIDLFCHQSLQLPWCIIQECQSQWGRISRSQVSPQLHSLILHKCKPLKANSPHSWTLTSVEQGRHSIKISILQLPIFGATVFIADLIDSAFIYPDEHQDSPPLTTTTDCQKTTKSWFPTEK